ncbi:3-phosphoshikimate 1-carboxyvinyltransferase [Corynebacterium choanae]|nr:3-phosphoshikimate 1-carboxyvinyltransferase [Corynebacterium choanae]
MTAHASADTGSRFLAPHASRPITASVHLPGSKSITNRALVLAALADGTSTITGGLAARDTQLMMDALRTLGATIDEEPATHAGEPPVWRVTGGPLRGGSVECGLAGTVMRFVPPIAALTGDVVHFDGDESARLRPMQTMCDALRDLGAHVTGNALPFTVDTSAGIPAGGRLTVDASASSQFVSGLLLAAPRFPAGLTITHVGANLPSQPHIDMTVSMLAEAGCEVAVDGTTWRVEPQPIHPHDWIVEPDLSNAGPFLAAAMVTGGTVTINQWPVHTTQPGAAFIELFTRMGGTAVFLPAEDPTSPVPIAAQAELATALQSTHPHCGHGSLALSGPAKLSDLTGITVDLSDLGELTPTLAAVCTLASTPSTLSGIGHLRGHETDRLQALSNEIVRLGGSCTTTADSLTITPQPLHAAALHTYADHRMATFAAIIGLVVEGVEIYNIATTAKTIADFPAIWQAMISGK